MRFLETLLVVFAAIYVVQLAIMALLIATLMLFLWCLYKRPREAMVVLAVAFISTPIGLALSLIAILGFGLWAFIRQVRTTRSQGARCGPLLLPPPDRWGG